MTREHVQDGQATFDRIAAACDRIATAGYPKVADAIGGYTRERRGRVQVDRTWPEAIATGLIDLADEAEQLVVAVTQQHQLPAPSEHAERRRDHNGQVWTLVRDVFRRWDGEEVVVATSGWEQGDQVRRDLHIPAAQWLGWEIVR